MMEADFQRDSEAVTRIPIVQGHRDPAAGHWP